MRRSSPPRGPRPPQSRPPPPGQQPGPPGLPRPVGPQAGSHRAVPRRGLGGRRPPAMPAPWRPREPIGPFPPWPISCANACGPGILPGPFCARLVQPLLFVPAIPLFLLLRPGVTGTLLLWSLRAAGLALAYLNPLRRAFRPSDPAPTRCGPRWGARVSSSPTAPPISSWPPVGPGGAMAHRWGAGPGGRGLLFRGLQHGVSGIFFGQASRPTCTALHREGGGSGVHCVPCGGPSPPIGPGRGHAGGRGARGPDVFRLIFMARDFRLALPSPGLGVLLAVSVLNYLWLSMLLGLNRPWVAIGGLALILIVKVALGIPWIPLQGAMSMVRAALWAESPPAWPWAPCLPSLSGKRPRPETLIGGGEPAFERPSGRPSGISAGPPQPPGGPPGSNSACCDAIVYGLAHSPTGSGPPAAATAASPGTGGSPPSPPRPWRGRRRASPPDRSRCPPGCASSRGG